MLKETKSCRIKSSSKSAKPNFTPGSLNFANSRYGQSYFNTSLFNFECCSTPACPGDGTQHLCVLGNANSRFFHDPGIANWDFGLLKDLRLTEAKKLEFRAEFFSILNHAQFNLPNGDIIGSDFGMIHSARDPRIGQLAMKFLF